MAIAFAVVLLLPLCWEDPVRAEAARPLNGSNPSPDHVYDETVTISQWYRYLDTAGHAEAERYIESVFEDYGLNTTVQEYTAHRRDGNVRAANVLGLLEGQHPCKCLVLGGHYDAHQYATHAAYDNAVGVGSVIELARLFSQDEEGPPPISMLFATWDSEEGGGAGSNHFLDNVPWQTEIVAYINLDMYSLNYPVRNSIPFADEEYFKLNVYTSPVQDFTVYDRSDFNESTLDNFTMFRELVESIAYDQFSYPREWVQVKDDTAGISDHRFFIERSIPAVWLRGMNERPREEGDLNEITFKHTPIDTVEAMERYAGGKGELLRGIETGLLISYSLAVQLLEHYNASFPPSDDGTAGENIGGNFENAGQIIAVVAALGLMLTTMVLYVFRKMKRYRSRGKAEDG